MVNLSSRLTTGLWRLRDVDGDDRFEEVKLLRAMHTLGGEHGPHAIVPGPDGRSIYFANGNHSALPRPVEHSRPVAWGGDHLIPRLRSYTTLPAGYVGRSDPEGKSMEVVAIGFRNQYDIALIVAIVRGLAGRIGKHFQRRDHPTVEQPLGVAAAGRLG